MDAACSRRNGAYPPRQHTHTHTHAKAHTTPPPWEGVLRRILQGKVSYVPPPYRQGRARAGSCSRSPLATCVFFFNVSHCTPSHRQVHFAKDFAAAPLWQRVFFFLPSCYYIYMHTYIQTYVYVYVHIYLAAPPPWQRECRVFVPLKSA